VKFPVGKILTTLYRLSAKDVAMDPKLECFEEACAVRLEGENPSCRFDYGCSSFISQGFHTNSIEVNTRVLDSSNAASIPVSHKSHDSCLINFVICIK
jgi:hypothetical protein